MEEARKQELLSLIGKVTPFSESIKKLYNKLAKLEIQNKKESSEYNQTLENIKMVKEYENKYLNKSDMNYDDLVYVSQTVKYINNIPPKSNLLEDLITTHKTTKINRLINLLNDYNIHNICFIDDFSKIPANTPETEQIKKQYIEKTSDSIRLSNYVEITILRTVLYTLNKTITSTQSTKLKNELIKLKFELIYSYPRLEAKLLSNSENEYTLIDINKDSESYNSINKETYQTIINNTFLGSIREIQYGLINTTNNEYDNFDSLLTYTIDSIFLKSYLLIMNNPKDIEYLFHDAFEYMLTPEVASDKNKTKGKQLLLYSYQDAKKMINELK